ncbi:MAG: NHL repeat-containing protein [Phycisphaerae bacterium]|nr:NHL repeat-containing protein [Phycisphaerae bacterium]
MKLTTKIVHMKSSVKWSRVLRQHGQAFRTACRTCGAYRIKLYGVICFLSMSITLQADIVIPATLKIDAVISHHIACPPEKPLVMPTDVALDNQDRIYVPDGVNDRIGGFTSTGQVDAIIDLKDDGQLDQPVGIAIDPNNNNLWIADSGHHRVVIVSPEGKLLENLDLPPGSKAHPTDPTDIAITSDGKRSYIIDNDNHRVLLRNNVTGKFTLMGRKGRSLGQFDYPFMACTGTEDYCYVVEVMGARIQRISPTGRWSGLISSWGVERGQMYRPKGIAADAKGNIYVSDSTLQVIQVFGPWGRFQGVLCDIHGHPLKFDFPAGLSFDSKGRLYVVELTSNRIAVVTLN